MPVIVDPQAERVFRSLESLLRREDLRLLTEENRVELLTDWEDIDERERRLDDRLFIGLVGGTGVGKSTFINALAGREISSSSDRRPTTDRITVYSHESLELPDEFPTSDLSEPRVHHTEEALERVVLLDFPDFDSVEAKHRDILFRFLPHLDVVFVLSDDVKYADRCLFDLLSELPHDSRNIYYVLNKIDALRTRYASQSETIVEEMLEDWRGKLREHAGLDVESDRLYAISALEALNAGDGEARRAAGSFSVVLDLLSSYREEKWRREAKSLNLLGRKHANAVQVRSAVLSEENGALLPRLRECLDSWARELGESLDRLSDEALNEPQRRSLRAQSLGGSAERWPMPISLFFSTFARRARRRATRAAGVEDRFDRAGLVACIRRHYRATLDVFANLASAVSVELEGSHVSFEFSSDVDRGSSERSDEWAEEIAQRLAGSLEDVAAAPPSISRLSVHGPAALLVVVALGGRFIAGYSETAADEGFFAHVGGGFGRSLTPTVLVSVAAAAIVAYGLVAYGQWSKRGVELDEAVARLLGEVRETVESRVRGGLEQFTEFVAALDREWEEVEGLFEGFEA